MIKNKHKINSRFTRTLSSKVSGFTRLVDFCEAISSRTKRGASQKLTTGFTLIETVIYLALFSIMIGGLMVVVFQLNESAGKLTYKDIAQEEINFVLKKMDWALTDASNVSTTINTLTITNFSNDKKVFRLNGNRIEFCQSTSLPCTNFNFITTLNIKVNSLAFTKINTIPSGVTMNLNINNLITTYTKYLRI